jgi:hypothetical protein
MQKSKWKGHESKISEGQAQGRLEVDIPFPSPEGVLPVEGIGGFGHLNF